MKNDTDLQMIHAKKMVEQPMKLIGIILAKHQEAILEVCREQQHKISALEDAFNPIRTLMLFTEDQLHTDEDMVFHFRNQIRMTIEKFDEVLK